MADGDGTATWGWLKRYCQDNRVSDDAVLMLDIDEQEMPVRDIDNSEGEPAHPAEEGFPAEDAVPPTLIFKNVYG